MRKNVPWYSDLILLLTIILSPILNVLWMLGIRYTKLSIRHSIKYQAWCFVVPNLVKQIRCNLASLVGNTGLFDMVVAVNDELLDSPVVYHELGHIKTALGCPDGQGAECHHSKKAALYELAADRYAARHGAAEDLIKYLEDMYNNPELRNINQDIPERIQALKHWQSRHCK